MPLDSDASVAKFLKLFRGLGHIHAIQWVKTTKSGLLQGYAPVYRPMQPQDVFDHFRGRKTLGMYVLDIFDRANVVAWDFDIGKGVTQTPRVIEILQGDVRKHCKRLEEAGFTRQEYGVEKSGRRGYHVWIFLAEPIPGKYAAMFNEKVATLGSPELASEAERLDKKGHKPEFFPKQESLEDVEKAIGNLIKLPLGIHQLQYKYHEQNPEKYPDIGSAYFVDPDTFRPILPQLDFLDRITPAPKGKIEAVIGEKIPDAKPVDEEEANQRVIASRAKHKHVRASLYDIYPTDDRTEAGRETHNIMHAALTGNEDASPPCIKEAYLRCAYMRGTNPRYRREQFYTRDLVVKYLAAKSFNINEIAGFFRSRVNNEKDNENPEILYFYLGFSYGTPVKPKIINSCYKIKRRGLCANFGYEMIKGSPEAKPVPPEDAEAIQELETRIRKMMEWKEQVIEQAEQIKKASPDFDAIIFGNDVEKDIKTVTDELVNKWDAKYHYKVKCNRFVTPLSDNGVGKKIKKKASDRDGITTDTATGESTQLVEYENYAEIKSNTQRMLQYLLAKTEQCIAIADKSTRVGVTTTMCLEALRALLKLLLVVPYNTIARDTFRNAVKISEDEALSTGKLGERKIEHAMFGAVLGANKGICLRCMIRIQKLREKFAGKSVLADDFPFITKPACIKRRRGKEAKVCKYWNYIQLGYMDDPDDRKPTPVVESYIPAVKESQWCSYHKADELVADPRNQWCRYRMESSIIKKHCSGKNSNKHVVSTNNCVSCEFYDGVGGRCQFPIGILTRPTNRCRFAALRKLNDDNVPVKCSDCAEYYEEKRFYIEHGELPICAYATIVRHMLGQEYKDTEPDFANKRKRSKNFVFNKLNTLSEEEVENLEGIGYRFVREGNKISSVVLRQYDVLALTYQKLNAIFKAEEIQKEPTLVGASDLITTLKTAMDVITFDEVSKLVGQSPSSTIIYQEIDEEDDAGNFTGKSSVEVDFLRSIADDMQKITGPLESGLRVVFTDELVESFRALTVAYNEFIGDSGRLNARGNVREWLLSDVKDDINSIMENGIKTPQGILVDPASPVVCKVRELQEKAVLAGMDVSYERISGRVEKHTKLKREKIRCINGIVIREDMRKIANEYRQLEGQKKRLFSQGKFTEAQALEFDEDEKVRKYKLLLEQLRISRDEILLTNLYVGFIYDGVDELGERGRTNPVVFEGYKQGEFTGINYIRIENRLKEFFAEKRFSSKDTTDDRARSAEKDLQDMYIAIELYAETINMGLPSLLSLLLLTSEESFYIDTTKTAGVKVQYTIQHEPTFVKVSKFARDFSNVSCKKILIATDATMPLAPIHEVFGLPTIRYKFGDPHHTCRYQLVIPYTRTHGARDIVGFGGDEKVIDEDDTVKGEVGDIVKSGKEGGRKYDAFVVSKGITSGNVRTKKVGNKIRLFKLVWFINAACDSTRKWARSYGDNYNKSREEVFLIFPNKRIERMFYRYSRKGGLALDYGLILYLQNHHDKLWNDCIRRGWLRQDTLGLPYQEIRSETVFKWVFNIPLGRNNNEDIGDNTVDMHFFRGDRTVGTSTEHRVMIAVCDPASPKRASDWLASYYHSQGCMLPGEKSPLGLPIEGLSKALRKNEVMSTFFQTISRVKDPNSLDPNNAVPSVVYCWGLKTGFFEWEKCSLCDRTMKKVYEEKKDAEYDQQYLVESDGIYTYQNEDGERRIMCHECAKSKGWIERGFKPVGYSPNSEEMLKHDAKGVSELLSFRVPVPQYYDSLPDKTKTSEIEGFPSVVKDEESYGDEHDFLVAEREMIATGVKWLREKTAPPAILLKVKRYIMMREIQRGERVEVALSDMKDGVKEGKMKKISEVDIKHAIQDLGPEKVAELGLIKVVTKKKGGSDYYSVRAKV